MKDFAEITLSFWNLFFYRSSYQRHFQGTGFKKIVSFSTGDTYSHPGDQLYEQADRQNAFSLKSLLPRFHSSSK